MDEAKEKLIPLILSGIALAIFVVYGSIAAGPGGAGSVVLVIGLQVAVGVPLAIVAFLAAARLLGISFGFIGPALRKVVAVYTFPTAVALLIPLAAVAWLVSFVLYFALLAWLFELSPFELVVTAIMMWLVRVAAIAVIVAVAA